jgi:hypothetical protein
VCGEGLVVQLRDECVHFRQRLVDCVLCVCECGVCVGAQLRQFGTECVVECVCLFGLLTVCVREQIHQRNVERL